MFSPRAPHKNSNGQRGLALNHREWENHMVDHQRRLTSCHSYPCGNKPTEVASSRTSRENIYCHPLSASVSQLPKSEQEVCHAMIALLLRRSVDESKQIVKEVFAAAESQRLLADYAGIFPLLVHPSQLLEARDEMPVS